MADLGLNLDLATSAVREDEAKKKNKPVKKKKHRPVRPHEGGSTGGLSSSSDGKDEFAELYTPKSQSGGKSKSGGRQAQPNAVDASGRPFLLHEELTDSDEEESSDDEMESFRQRFGRDGSRKKVGDTSYRYRCITGNVAPTDLSIARHLSDEDVLKLTSDENFGIVIQPVGFWQVGKKKRKEKRGLGLVDVTVIKYDFNGISATAAHHDDEEVLDDDDATTQTSAIIFGTRKKADRNRNAHKWPPRPATDAPAPPTDKPPKLRASNRFLSRPKSLSLPPPPPPPPKKSERILRAPPRPPARPPMKKQPSLVSTSMVSASGVIKKNMKKLAKFRGPSTHVTSPVRQVSANKIEERFLVAKRVGWIIPPPPRPRLPPPDGSDEQMLQLDFELLRMFCEDLRSTAVKLEEKQDAKGSQIAALQHRIQEMDDEIAGLVQPKGSARANNVVVTSELKSVTSGNIFRVEKY